jgi:hypothetical protein
MKKVLEKCNDYCLNLTNSKNLGFFKCNNFLLIMFLKKFAMINNHFLNNLKS